MCHSLLSRPERGSLLCTGPSGSFSLFPSGWWGFWYSEGLGTSFCLKTLVTSNTSEMLRLSYPQAPYFQSTLCFLQKFLRRIWNWLSEGQVCLRAAAEEASKCRLFNDHFHFPSYTKGWVSSSSLSLLVLDLGRELLSHSFALHFWGKCWHLTCWYTGPWFTQ